MVTDYETGSEITEGKRADEEDSRGKQESRDMRGGGRSTHRTNGVMGEQGRKTNNKNNFI